MSDFRKDTPCRRNDYPLYNDYHRYKAILREDFKCRCGYCGDHDWFKDSFYEIDHFVPKNILRNISCNHYPNLVYSCRLCNNKKRDKWPMKNESISNNGKIGFIDPCDENYSKQFKRIIDGSIYPLTEIGKWMSNELGFNNPTHRIRYQLETILCDINELEKTEKMDDKTIESLHILKSNYFDLIMKLKGTPNFL